MSDIPPPPKPPEPKDAEGTKPAKPPIWRRTWVAATATGVLGLGIGASGSSSDGDAAEEAVPTTSADAGEIDRLEAQVAELESALAAAEETASQAEVDLVEATATTAPPETTTTTTTPPTTTTAAALTSSDLIAVSALVFEEIRSEVIGVLEADIGVESVNALIYDQELNAVVLDVTSGWASSANQDEGAWELARGFASFWGPDAQFSQSEYATLEITDGEAEDFTPAFRMTVSGVLWDCPAQTMHALGDARLTESDARAQCGR